MELDPRVCRCRCHRDGEEDHHECCWYVAAVERDDAEARLAKVVEAAKEYRQLQEEAWGQGGDFVRLIVESGRRLDEVLAASPELGQPCSACGDGDTAQEFQHASPEPKEEP